MRNDNDLERHTDYIHVNPVNHGLTKRAQDYPYSSFKMFVEKEAYPEDWGSVVEIEVIGEPID